MKTALRSMLPWLRGALSDESGQAIAEYSSITFILLVGVIGVGSAWPFTRAMFLGLQLYFDLYTYALNLAIG